MSSSLSVGVNALWAALHTLQYGFGISAFNGIQDAVMCHARGTGGAPKPSEFLRSCIDISNAQFGLVVAIFTLGGLIGSLSTNTWTNKLGQLGALRLSAISVLVGSVITGLSNDYLPLLAGRIIIGFGCGLATVLVPLYLAEIAPSSMRRSIGVLNQFCIVLGILTGQSLSLPFAAPLKWRWVFVVAVGTAGLQLLGSFFVMAPKPHESEEERPLLPDTAPQEVLSIKQLLLSKDSAVRRGFVLVVITQLVQQLCGISPVMYFSTRILTPVFQSNSKYIALGIVLLKIPMTAVPAFIIERLGSKPILLFSSLAMSLCSLLLALGLNTDSQPLSVVAILAFVSAFSIGLGPVTWVVLPEVMPKHAVTAAGSVGLGINWLTNFGMGASFLPLQQWMATLTQHGEGNIFFLFSAFCLVGFVAILSAYRLRESV